MSKILRLSLACMLSVFFGTAFAQTSFNFNNDYAELFPTLAGTSSNDSGDGDFTEATTSTPVDGITVTVSAKDPSNNNANRIWSSTPRLRMYSGTLTVTAPDGKNITGIEYNCGKWNAGNKADSGELTTDGNNATWAGSAASVTLTIAGNTQCNFITVYLDGEEPVDISNTPETAYTVAEVLNYYNQSQGIGTKIYMKGIITEIKNVDTGYGNAEYYINDTESTEGQLKIYRGYYFDGDKFTSEDAIKVGDEVVIYGELADYYGTPQIAQGSSIYSLNGETTPPAPSVDISNTPETAYNVAKAYELIYAGEGLETEVYVKGVIVSIDEISVGEGGFGNATYNINDTDSPEGQLKVFHGYYLGGEKFTTGEEIKVGDEVVVYGKLINYNGTYEINSGNELYSVNGFTTGINKVTVDADDADAPVYNLAGQRVSKDAKGILIKNGKKFINK